MPAWPVRANQPVTPHRPPHRGRRRLAAAPSGAPGAERSSRSGRPQGEGSVCESERERDSVSGSNRNGCGTRSDHDAPPMKLATDYTTPRPCAGGRLRIPKAERKAFCRCFCRILRVVVCGDFLCRRLRSALRLSFTPAGSVRRGRGRGRRPHCAMPRTTVCQHASYRGAAAVETPHIHIAIGGF